MTISGQPEVLKAIEIYPDVFIFSVSNPFVHNFNFVKKKKRGGEACQTSVPTLGHLVFI